MNDLLTLYYRWNLQYQKILNDDFSYQDLVVVCKNYIKYKNAGGKRRNDYLEKVIKHYGVVL